MKIVYNTVWLDNLQMQKKAKEWWQQDLISKEEEVKVAVSFPVGFYMPSFWLTLGLFLFTLVLLFAAEGLVTSLFLLNDLREDTMYQFLLLTYSAVCFWLTEVYKKKKHYFQAGTDNALLWTALTLLISAVGWILEDVLTSETAWVLTWLFAAGCCLLAVVRYSDPFVAFGAFLSWLLFLFFLTGQLEATSLLPFVSLGNALCLYFFAKSVKGRAWVYYGNCLKVCEIAALVTAYLSVNYFVVRELSAEMFQVSYVQGEEIPLAYLFYFLTIALPPLYIYLGLKKKDRWLLRIGLLLVVASVLTIRQYHSLLPIEIALTGAGAIIVIIAYWLIRWLQTPRYGFTFVAEKEAGLGIAESLILVESFAKGSAPSPTESQFGGGDFGGGGAGDSY